MSSPLTSSPTTLPSLSFNPTIDLDTRPRSIPMPESPTTPTQASVNAYSPRLDIPEVRPQAGPLPSKRGEIGYSEELHGAGSGSRSRTPTSPMPARHPADRQSPVAARPEVDGPDAPPSSSTPTTPNPATPPAAPSIRKPRWKPAKILGVRITTIALLVLQFLLAGVTIAGWVFAAQKITFGDPNSSDNASVSFGSSTIFVHVLFGVLLIVQLIFIERRIFVVRAERFMFLHPGEMLPRHRQDHYAGGIPGMGYAPWNRPPLPTYAAALVQSGWGTGDVEDHIIAAPPPPAYGNTRGSTLLLAGFLRNSFVAQRPISSGSIGSQITEQVAIAARGRPMSYVSVADSQSSWTVVNPRRVSQSSIGSATAVADARRSLILEQTLLALERPQPAALRPES